MTKWNTLPKNLQSKAKKSSETVKPKKQSTTKYHNEIVEMMGLKFQSKKECGRFAELWTMQTAGEIKHLRLQVRYQLIEGYTVPETNERIQAVDYIADFVYTDNEGKTVVEDSKGMKTEGFIIKHKMFLRKYPDFKFILT